MGVGLPHRILAILDRAPSEQDPRDVVIEQQDREIGRLRDDLARHKDVHRRNDGLQRQNERLRRENEHLKKQLGEERRAGRRQAAPLVVYQFQNRPGVTGRASGGRLDSMPRGPKGEWRPADPVACAVHVGRIATGEIKETHEAPRRPDPTADKARASKGGKARAAALTPERRREIAATGASARWGS